MPVGDSIGVPKRVRHLLTHQEGLIWHRAQIYLGCSSIGVETAARPEYTP